LALCAAYYFLSLPSEPTVAGYALAIRIVFPLVGVTPVSFSKPVMPAMLGKPQKGPDFSGPFALYRFFLDYIFGGAGIEPAQPCGRGILRYYIKHCYTYLVEKSVKRQSRTLEKDLLPIR
jgi:hypothetical protein